jgi:hypothetical protein
MKILALGVAVLIGIFIGVFIGIFVGTERMRKAIEARSLGWLRIDHSELDEPARMFTELKGVTPDMIAQDKFVIFEVVNESYISHD